MICQRSCRPWQWLSPGKTHVQIQYEQLSLLPGGQAGNTAQGVARVVAMKQGLVGLDQCSMAAWEGLASVALGKGAALPVPVSSACYSFFHKAG